jgi:hypothetical protein
MRFVAAEAGALWSFEAILNGPGECTGCGRNRHGAGWLLRSGAKELAWRTQEMMSRIASRDSKE